MPWYEETVMSQRREFIGLAGVSMKVSVACRGFGISRKTGYKWLDRFEAGGEEGLKDRSRRPRVSPNKTPGEIEQLVLEARLVHPAWGGRKLKRWLEDRGIKRLPAPSTITESSVGRAVSIPKRAGSGSHYGGSRARSRTTCGRWTSRAGSISGHKHVIP